jgi:hypothetical protein
MVDSIVKKLNDLNKNKDIKFHYYDFKSDCQLFCIHIAINAYLKSESEATSFSKYISNIFGSFENTYYDYKTANFIGHLNKYEIGWTSPNNNINVITDDKAVMRRHLLEFIIDGILHQTIIDSIPMVLCRYRTFFKIFSVTKEGDFDFTKYIVNENRIDILWVHSNDNEDNYYLLSERKLDNFDVIYNNVKNMWLEYCEISPIVYLLKMLEIGQENMLPVIVDNYTRLLEPYDDGKFFIF